MTETRVRDAEPRPTAPGGEDARRRVRLARALASPLGVLITIPALVVAVGVGILLVGRDATRTTSSQMARRLLTSNATSVPLTGPKFRAGLCETKACTPTLPKSLRPRTAGEKDGFKVSYFNGG